MKPIHLKLAGLQSYREAQEIDFTELCDAGVFGIFGPTGSGKSSILDAMTLAMYGKVERALNGTQGIMNQAEDKLFVSFTFEIENAQSQYRYRVERQFKRNNDVSISNTISRFVQINSDGEVVLADKAQEVNHKVQDLLGLSIQDFTRAVVLPQGKFAEFLLLKGSDRRQMLQRLFHLEQYGDMLQIKLSQRVKDTNLSLKQCEAEQQGLGDASLTALEQATERMTKQQQYTEKLKLELQQIDQEFQIKQKIWELQQELSSSKQRLDEQLKLEEQINHLEAKLEQAEQAERIKPFLEQWEAAINTHQSSVERFNETDQKLIQLKQERIKTESEYGLVYESLKDQEPQLIAKQHDYRQAMDLEKELEILRTELSQLTASRQEIKEKSESHEVKLIKESELLEKAQHKQTQLKAELLVVEVGSELRKAFRDAQSDYQGLRLRHKTIQEQVGEYNEHEKIREELTNIKSLKVEQFTTCQNTVLKLWREVEKYFFQLQLQQTMVKRLELKLPVEIKAAKSREHSQEVHHYAVKLAAELNDNERCLVCGSLEHPEPARALSEEQESIPSIPELEQLLLDVRELSMEFRSHEQMFNLMKEQLEDSIIDRVEAEAAVSLEEDLTSELSKTSSIDQIKVLCHQVTNSIEQHSFAVNQGIERLKPELLQLNNMQQELRQLSTRVESAQEQFTRLEQRLIASKQEKTKLEREWESSYPHFQLTQFPEIRKDIEARELKADELQQRIQKSVEYIESKQQELEALKQQAVELERAQLKMDAEHVNKSASCKEKSDKLYAAVGNEKAAAKLEEADLLLKQLREKEQSLKQKLEVVHAAYQTASNEWSAASQAKVTAEENKIAQAERMNSVLAKTSFHSIDQVKSVIVDEAVIQQWIEQIKQHRELEKELYLKLRQIEEQLQGRSITNEEWSNSQSTLQVAKQKYEDSIHERASKERDYEVLSLKHTRWTELEEQRQSLQEMLSSLQKLQSVFRGNAFVEFIAEEQLMVVSQNASERLGHLTRQRYAIEVDSSGGFMIRDDANGGVKRPVSTLSGGETFLTSLALALALSAQIQLKGQYPLQFFFLDEGFGTLDQDLLESVISALEKLHSDHLAVGIISHVPELRSRLAKKLIVHPAEPAGRGSRVSIETL